ncbi:MAG TPA: thioredoxin domain-containing protein, partial [Chitinophagaceae bacterium]|nr:thioredoxin domain-containing protein [Chitinophagaceae bacterium]
MNHLANETSPYLLQHAHNPVDWYPWGEEALNRAKSEDKPILVSIGYAACHWCHVMERESFEDVSTAELMNLHFVNIKIDREERPDLDHIYMEAVQVMSGSGGWPLNVFLTPDGRPFYGGTYYPPVRAFNRASWKEILSAVNQAYAEKKEEILQQASNLTEHLVRSNLFGVSAPDKQEELSELALKDVVENILKNADAKEGGFGRAPKFPQTFSIQYLLRDYYYTNDPRTLDQAVLSLDKMCLGGIYDQIGGGFARYSTDDEWLAPHFEKMLYDNALLVIAFSEAFQITEKPLYSKVIAETIGFVERELMSEEGGFYSALDADSEGEEGRFYVWSRQEFDSVLKENAELIARFYDVSNTGNWEGKNILRIRKEPAVFAQENNLSETEFANLLSASNEKLLSERSKRVRPLLDDKTLLGWNALMNLACSKAFMATADEKYRKLALKNMDFLLRSFRDDKSGAFFHTYKNGKAKTPAFLDDYAALIQAQIALQEITGDKKYLREAAEITEYVIRYFSDEDSIFFYYTHEEQKDVIFRKKEIYDGATPSGNAMMANNLLYLSVVFDKAEWRERFNEMVKSLSDVIRKYPTSFGHWASLLQAMIKDRPEIVL